MTDPADDPRLLAVASAVADGTPVNWKELDEVSTGEPSAVLDALRAVSRLSGARDRTPASWGSFTIVGQIGEGQFGRVYQAVDPHLRRDVALKIIAAPGGRAFDLDAALDEGRLLARLDHPNVVRVYRADRIGDQVGIAMELVKGITLDAMLRRNGPLGAQDAAVIGLDLCRALAALHAAGTLHGDIKARNVMREPGGRTVVMDLGAGRDLAVEPGIGRDFAGTPVYLAPEVFAGRARSRASDIYSLGVLLYYLVTGSYPVEGPTTTSIGRQHRAPGSRRRLLDARPDLPDPFVRAVERALAERPEDRYESAGAFEAALAGVIAPERQPAVTRAVVLAAAAAAVVALTGAAITFWPAPIAPATTVAGPAPLIAPPAGAYRIEAALYAERNGAEVRLPRGARVAPGDRISLQIETSVPVHVYVVNEDEQGEAYLLFPLPGSGLVNPLLSGRRHRLPAGDGGERLSWQVTTAGGQEHFVIFANPQPSPEFEEMFASLPAPSLGASAQAVRLSQEAVGVLRGVGGLAAAPQEPLAAQLRLARDVASPLVEGQETVRGVWVRQITLENPAP